MPETSSDTANSEFSIHGTFWSLYLLGGLQTLAYAGFTILIVQLSLIMWPEDPYHALEIGKPILGFLNYETRLYQIFD